MTRVGATQSNANNTLNPIANKISNQFQSPPQRSARPERSERPPERSERPTADDNGKKQENNQKYSINSYDSLAIHDR
jgi:hypothetical protein